MAKLAEQYVIEYLNREGFTTAQSLKKGNNEWDLFAIRVSSNKVEARQVEVQVSFDPVSYLSNRNAKRRSDEEVNADMQKWMEKKFPGDKVREVRALFFPGAWSYELVHGVLADEREMVFLERAGVSLCPFDNIIASLCKDHPRELPFVAEGKDAVEIVRSLIRTKT